MSAFFAMDGYAMYVWPAFAVFIVVLALDFILPRFHKRRILKEIRARQRRKQHKRGS